MTRLLLILALASATTGCATVGYYGQAVGGQLKVLAARRPIERVIADPATDPETARRLRLAREFAAWAPAGLALPESPSYRSYVALEGEAPVWSVMATPEFSFTPRISCFPFAGCLAYRGFFSRAAAERHAARLRAQGDDVAVMPAPAYSTLGWFADPVFSSMLAWDDATLAETLFHELAHERVYSGDDTAFDEAYATAVGREGVRRLFGAREPALLPQLARQREVESAFVALLAEARAELETLYASGLAVEEMRAGKHRILAALPARARELGARLGRAGMFDAWFVEPVDNARLVGVGTYEDLVPAFERLLAAEQGDLARFHQRVEALARETPAARRAALTALTATGGEPQERPASAR